MYVVFIELNSTSWINSRTYVSLEMFKDYIYGTGCWGYEQIVIVSTLNQLIGRSLQFFGCRPLLTVPLPSLHAKTYKTHTLTHK